jgi:hypothetical protein
MAAELLGTRRRGGEQDPRLVLEKDDEEGFAWKGVRRGGSLGLSWVRGAWARGIILAVAPQNQRQITEKMPPRSAMSPTRALLGHTRVAWNQYMQC